VLPADHASAYQAADPVQKDGTPLFDDKKNADREDAIVRQLLKQKVAVVILGGSHDLTDNADRVSGGMCEVVTVTTDAYRRIAEPPEGN
jgi:hypothetical protein